MYSQPATALTPALVIYLIDASDSMNEPCDTATKITLVNQALRAAVKDMVRRSMRDGVVQRRYKIAIFAYSTQVIDVLGGIRDLPDLLKSGVPELSAGGVTDTAAGFAAVEALLGEHLAEFQHSPAPLVCHLTDGVFTTVDPSPSIRRIQGMGVHDGTVLVENVYVADGMLRKPVADWRQWPGIQRENELANDYAAFLFSLSSPMPETYRQNINNYGYHIQPGAALFFPGFHSDLVRLAFVISAATQLK
ncbi:MAG TPA: vWA domain-containing protein [Ktedonobacterales bacterium]|nr:vWA domain-containing protein [Ktedonobacterales bacterium]